MEPASSRYGAAPDESQRATEMRPTAITRARTGLVVLAAVLTEIVVIAALGNQWVTKHIADSILRDQLNRAGRPAGFGTDFKTALLTYNWRFSPLPTDHQNILLSQVVLIVATLVLSGLLIAAVVRGPGTFSQGFFATWMAVVVATMLGAYLRGVVNTVFPRTAAQVFFGALGPNSFTFFAALMLGFVAALVAGAVAATTRRTVPVAAPMVSAPTPYLPPEQPPPYYGEPARTGPERAPWQDQRYGPPTPTAPRGDADQPTTALPTVPPGDDAGEPTTQLPSLGEEGRGASAPAESAPAESAPPDEAGTTRFPRPPEEDPGRPSS
ncbi:MAG TPA: hypothetical protein VKB75_14365 [Jatrophihabitans sp.]|nr:hypothetical protein [Jatrophihabitans sp.]